VCVFVYVCVRVCVQDAVPPKIQGAVPLIPDACFSACTPPQSYPTRMRPFVTQHVALHVLQRRQAVGTLQTYTACCSA